MNEELKAVIAHHITIAMDAAKPETPTLDAQGNPIKGAKPKTPKKDPSTLDSLKRLTGISITAAGILKQSQVFTGVIGTVFQLLGAMIDVMLAPFLPVLLPAIKFMASLIPIISKNMTGVAKGILAVLGFLKSGWDWLTGFKLSKELEGIPGVKWLNGLSDAKVTDFIKNAIAFMIPALVLALALGQFRAGRAINMAIAKLGVNLVRGLGKGLLITLPRSILSKVLGTKVAGTVATETAEAAARRTAQWQAQRATQGGGNLLTRLFGSSNKVNGPGHPGWVRTAEQSMIPKVNRLVPDVAKETPSLLRRLTNFMRSPFSQGGPGGIAGKVIEPVAAKSGARLGLGVLAAFPGIGNVIGFLSTLGFGALDTKKNYDEHGTNAAILTAAGAIAGAVVTVLPGPGTGTIGMATQIASAMAVDAAFNNMKQADAASGQAGMTQVDIRLKLEGMTMEERVIKERNDKLGIAMTMREVQASGWYQ
jgi:hypothetical protein